MTELTLSIAKKLEGKTVTLSGDTLDESVQAKVAEVIQNTSNGDEWECFSVILDLGEAPPEFNQGVYAFDSDEYKNENVFVSPNSFTECEIVVSRKIVKN